jgi:predicted GH43/DUF377 family glycosyl hydrolase
MKRSKFIGYSTLIAASATLIPDAIKAGSVTNSSDSLVNNSPFWNLFSDNYQKNCRLWRHNTLRNPVIPAGNLLWKKFWTANPTVISFNEKLLVYYRGNGITPTNPGRHDRIAVAQIKELTPDNIVIEDLNNQNFTIDVGEKGSFDDSDVLDPGAVVFKNKVFLYYSGVGTGPNSVGLAISENGIRFQKHGSVLIGRSPSVIMAENKIYMIYQNDNGKGFRGFYLAESEDGINFKDSLQTPVLGGMENGWDKFVTTARLYKENDTFLMLYGGSPDLNDQPDYFGLARSKDLRNWEKHPGNPIFGLGAKGEEDGGAIWFPALIDIGSHYVLIYEGSRGRYSWDLSSQICMSSIQKK